MKDSGCGDLASWIKTERPFNLPNYYRERSIGLILQVVLVSLSEKYFQVIEVFIVFNCVLGWIVNKSVVKLAKNILDNCQ